MTMSPPRLPACFALLYAGAALSEPSVLTTANQAESMAPFWVWWLSLGVATLALHPALMFLTLRSLSTVRPSTGALLGLSAFHFLTGAAALISMFAVSLASSRTSPIPFIAFWAGLSLLLSGGYVVRVMRKMRRT